MGPLSVHGDPVAPLRFALGLAVAVPGVLFIDAVMTWLPDGEAPPQVATRAA